MNPPHPIAVWLSGRIWLIWTFVALQWILIYMIAVFIGGITNDAIIAGLAVTMLIFYFLLMMLLTKALRGVRSDVEYLSRRSESNLPTTDRPDNRSSYRPVF